MSEPIADDAPSLSPAPATQAVAGLVLVSTPIGNLGDMTSRARAVLERADLILCEDTRTTQRLLSGLGMAGGMAGGVSARLEALHEHNEAARVPALLERLARGACIALVSDAGTPLVSDPGYRLVRAAIAAGLAVSAAPGPNAALTALTLSGLPPHPFLFLGFAPPRQAARRAAFGRLRAAEQAGLAATLIWHEAPHRLGEMLADLRFVFADRPAVVARELTKRFEEVRRGSLATLAEHYGTHAARGEVTVLLGPPDAAVASGDELETALRQALAGHSVRDAAALVATATGLPRKQVYARALEMSAGASTTE